METNTHSNQKVLESNGMCPDMILQHMTHFKLEVMILCQGVSKILTAYRI